MSDFSIINDAYLDVIIILLLYIIIPICHSYVWRLSSALVCISDILVGLRLLGATTDINEAMALSYANDIVDVYSNSWGPADSGSSVEGPDILTRMVLRIGAEEVSQKYKWEW